MHCEGPGNDRRVFCSCLLCTRLEQNTRGEQLRLATYLEDTQRSDQAAHLVLQREHHGRLAGLLGVLRLRALVDGAEGGAAGLEPSGHSHGQTQGIRVLASRI